MITIAVVNLKGGTGKTTTCAFMAAAFHEAGMRVLAVDADGENHSLVEWQAQADLPWPVVGMPVANLHKTLPGVAGDRYDVVVIDTPPMQAQRGTVLSAARIATHVVVPLAPTQMEYDRLIAVRELLDDATDLRADGQPPVSAVFLTRCKPRAASTAHYRELAVDAGWTVLDSQVNDRELYRQAKGDPITGAVATPYGDAAMELLDLKPKETAA